MIHRNLSIAVIGDESCGKSTLLRCVASGFTPISEIDSYLFDKESVEVAVDSTFKSMVIFKNTSGKEQLESLRREYVAGSDGILACFSLIDPSSLEALGRKWIPDARQILGPDVPILVVGLKMDEREALKDSSDESKRASKRYVPILSKEAQSVCKKLKATGYFETSARNAENVKDCILDLLRHATLFKIKQDKNQRASMGSGSPSSAPNSPRISLMDRLLPNRSSTKQRLSQRLLEVALSGEKTEALELISKGAHVSWASVDSKSSPLHAAAKAGNLDVLNVLLYAKADINLKDNNGATALHVACLEGNFDCAKALLDKGANPNATNLIDCTPLHEAAAVGRRDIVELLLERGANDEFKDIGGHTPRDRAATAGHPLLFSKTEQDQEQ